MTTPTPKGFPDTPYFQKMLWSTSSSTDTAPHHPWVGNSESGFYKKPSSGPVGVPSSNGRLQQNEVFAWYLRDRIVKILAPEYDETPQERVRDIKGASQDLGAIEGAISKLSFLNTDPHSINLGTLKTQIAWYTAQIRILLDETKIKKSS